MRRKFGVIVTGERRHVSTNQLEDAGARLIESVALCPTDGDVFGEKIA